MYFILFDNLTATKTNKIRMARIIISAEVNNTINNIPRD